MSWSYVALAAYGMTLPFAFGGALVFARRRVWEYSAFALSLGWWSIRGFVAALERTGHVELQAWVRDERMIACNALALALGMISSSIAAVRRDDLLRQRGDQ